ncbi:hypothetical protein ACIMS2_002335 [Vibrio harveyi]
MIFDHETHILRVLLLEMAKHEKERDSDKVHINAILNRCAPFLDVTTIKFGIEMLCLTNELVSFGMGWYGLAHQVNIADEGISVGWNGREPHDIYRQAYQAGNINSNVTLYNWLGPPFSFHISTGSVYFDISGAAGLKVSSKSEVYWADTNTEKAKDQSNWLDIQSAPQQLVKDGLYRVDKRFFHEFYNSYNANVVKVEPKDAYEIASLKDYLRGASYPFAYDTQDGWIVLKQKRYIPTALKKLAFLLCCRVSKQGMSLKYCLTESSFDQFRYICDGYVNLFKEKI